jgi:quercetin dioxygenase-like cupin family protein
MSLRSLAEKTDFSASFISQVENGQASPSIASMERIALALGVTLGEFFQHTEDNRPVVVKAGERLGLKSEWSKARIEALGPMGMGSNFEAVMVTLFPGGTSGKHPYPQPNSEFAIVFLGAVMLKLGDAAEQELVAGDAVSIRPGLPRQWKNVTAEQAQIVVVANRAG